MVKSLVEEGVSVAAWNRSNKSIDLPPEKFSLMGSAASVLYQTDISIMCLSNGKACNAVLSALPDNIVVEEHQKIIINLTTLHPRQAAKLERLAAQKGYAYIDAAFTGGIPSVQNRSSFFIVACSEELSERATPILTTLGENIMWVGSKIGDAQRYKAINQAISAVHHYGACLAVAFARVYEVPPQILLERMHEEEKKTRDLSSSWVTRQKLDAIINNDFSGHHSVENFLKDVRIARSLIREERLRKFRIGDLVFQSSLFDKFLLQAYRSLLIAKIFGHGDDASHIMVRFTRHDRRAWDFLKSKIKKPTRGEVDSIGKTFMEYALSTYYELGSLSELLGVSQEAVSFMLQSGSGDSGAIRAFRRSW